MSEGVTGKPALFFLGLRILSVTRVERSSQRRLVCGDGCQEASPVARLGTAGYVVREDLIGR